MDKHKYQITYYPLEATSNHREHSKGPNPYAPVFDFKWAYSDRQAKLLSRREHPSDKYYLSSVKEV
jgi:hypothetical protein